MILGPTTVGGDALTVQADRAYLFDVLGEPAASAIIVGSLAVFLDGSGGGAGAQQLRPVVAEADDIDGTVTYGEPIEIEAGAEPGWVHLAFDAPPTLRAGHVPLIGVLAGPAGGVARLHGVDEVGQGHEWAASYAEPPAELGAPIGTLTNRVRNPRLATDLATWGVTFASAGLSSSLFERAALPAGAADPGSFALRIRGVSPSSTARVVYYENDATVDAMAAVTPGDWTVIADVYVATYTAGQNFRIEAYPRDAALGTLAPQVPSNDAMASVGWHRYVRKVTFPAGTAWTTLRPLIAFSATTTADRYVTRMMLVQGDHTADPPDYFDETGEFTSIDFLASGVGLGVTPWAPPAGLSDEEIAALPIDVAQHAFDAAAATVPGVAARAGWRYLLEDPPDPATCVVRSDGPLADLVGERLRVTAATATGPASVVVYVDDEQPFDDELADEDLALSRAAFMRVAPLWPDAIDVLVEVLA